MCLNIIEKENLDESGYGWKILRKKGDRLASLYEYPPIIDIVENKWLTSKRGVNLEMYRVGFHIYYNKNDAIKLINIIHSDCVLRKVKFKEGHTKGSEAWRNVIVADRILILPELNIFRRLYQYIKRII